MLRNGEPLAFLERGGRTMLSLQPLETADWAAVAEALATASLEGRVGSLQLERIDGESAAGTPRRRGVHGRRASSQARGA